MAERNPSKQRRQAQNRAARDARKARSDAANTPVTERRTVPEADDDERGSRRRRRSASQDEVKAKARRVIRAADAADDGEAPEDVTDDRGAPRTDATPAPPRRGFSPVFSARHRQSVAAATADAAPARTHPGVIEATGVTAIAPRAAVRRPQGRAQRRTPTTTRAGTARATAVEDTADTSDATTKSQAEGAPRRIEAAARPRTGSARPPTRPLPGFLDRFGGNEPGGRWVMISFATLLIASIVLNFVHIVPEVVKNAKGKKVQTGTHFTIWHYGVGPGLYFLVPPILIMGLFIITARPWDRRRSWNIALACLVFITFITQSISIYVIPIAALAWGCWQARKAALDEVGGDPRVLREVERERRIAGKEAMRQQRSAGKAAR